MSLSRVGGSSVAATSVAIPAHVAGDLIVIWAYRDGSTTPPTVPAAAGTVPAFTTIDGPTGANLNSAVCAWAVAAGTNDTSGTWANATGISVEVWRGAATNAPIGGHAQSGASVASGANIAIPAITLTDASGNGVILAFAGWQTVTAWNAPPAGYTQRSQVATECEAISKDTTTSDATFNVTGTASGTGGTRTQQIELIADLGNRVSQESVEVLYGTTAAQARVSQEAVEVLVSIPTGGNRVSQVVVEVLKSRADVRNMDFIASVTAVYTPALVGGIGAPFISSVAAVYAPALVGNITPSFIASATSVYTPALQGSVTPSFIASTTSVYTPALQGSVTPSFIASSTVVYAPTVTAATSTVSPPFISSVTFVYGIGLPIRPPSGTVTLVGDEPIVYPLIGLIGTLVLDADDPTLFGAQHASSATILLKGDPPGLPSTLQPPSGTITFNASPPRLVSGFKPDSGKLILSATGPSLIIRQPPTGKLLLKGDAQTSTPIEAVPGRWILAASGPNVYPLKVDTVGVLLLKADGPTLVSANFLLRDSGIIRLRSDVPIVTPLTEPPPPPPPPQPGTGLAVSGPG